MTPGSHTPSPYTPQTPGAASGLTDALGSSVSLVLFQFVTSPCLVLIPFLN